MNRIPSIKPGETVIGRPIKVANGMVSLIVEDTNRTTKRTLYIYDIKPVRPIRRRRRRI